MGRLSTASLNTDFGSRGVWTWIRAHVTPKVTAGAPYPRQSEIGWQVDVPSEASALGGCLCHMYD